MPSIEPEELPRRRSRGELLEHIYAEGARRRRRRRMGSVGLSAAALAVVAGVVLTTNLPRSTPQHVATRGQTAPPSPGSSTSSLVLLPSTSAPLTTPAPTTAVVRTTIVPTTVRAGTVASTPSTTTRPVTTEAPGEPTTTSPPSTLATSVCINSSDEACGPFHWQPEPSPNAPLVIAVTSAARASDPRTFDFAIVYSDADAPIADGCRNVGFGDGEATFTGSTAACVAASCIAAYGAWTPPAAEPGRVETSVSHMFARAGTYDVTFHAQSRHSLCHDPYASDTTKTVTVVVP